MTKSRADINRSSSASKKIIQGSLFEDDYLVKSLGNIVRDAEYALTELVANAWDAGATKVNIVIPPQPNGIIKVVDNGVGLTADEFKQRWMKLGYNRQKHQGLQVTFPPDVDGGKRRAYGRNGIGRHGMFCFADSYLVVTKRAGTVSEFEIELSSGEHPFIIRSEKSHKGDGFGTTVQAEVGRNIPDANAIRETISARFIHDPRFVISVNGVTISLASHPGADDPVKLNVPDCGEVEVVLLDTQKSARTKQKQGFAFWVQNRLVGEPSWTVGSFTPIDARTTFGRRFTILVRCDCMESELEADWSGFKKGAKRNTFFKALNDFALEKYQEFSKEKIDETKRRAFEDNLASIRPLSGAGRVEVAAFVESVVEREPTIKPESLSTAVQAIINLQQTKSGQRLLEKLSALPSDDVAALDRLLSEWSAQDALTVLDEIDHRIGTVRAIELLANKKETDELHTLHPLVTEARWLFGPEFETNEYASNVSLKNAVNTVFKVESKREDYPNWRKRPDLLMLADSTISAVALEDIDLKDGLAATRKVLLLELKKGDSKIGRTELNQAEEYIDAIRNSGCINGNFFTQSFVLGSRIDTSVTLEKKLSANGVEHAAIKGVCYSTLTQTASKRLFKLKERLEERYAAVSQGSRSKVLDQLLSQQVMNLK
ncbi:MAG: ATP-binding protein [Verrucomicrobiales bacterium]|nr:ATP-binding protein [Verrucomicrobiales bacterium]